MASSGVSATEACFVPAREDQLAVGQAVQVLFRVEDGEKWCADATPRATRFVESLCQSRRNQRADSEFGAPGRWPTRYRGVVEARLGCGWMVTFEDGAQDVIADGDKVNCHGETRRQISAQMQKQHALMHE
jgi:hypothetical protein